MSMDFGTVYTITDWWDGPRKGIAEFNSVPHFYESEFDDARDEWPKTFLLAPLDEVTSRPALEVWPIWERWGRAVSEKRVARATKANPALPEDQVRRDQLEALLKDRLQIDSSKATRVTANFRRKGGEPEAIELRRPLEVSWTRVVEKHGEQNLS